MKKSLLTLLLSSLFLSGSALAQSTTPASHLDRIKETKILGLSLLYKLLVVLYAEARDLLPMRNAGYREQSIPFSYLNNGKPTGFGVELTERVAEAIRKKFNAPDVRIRWNAVTLSTRYPLMTTKTLDINCATDIHTNASEELVGFSNTFYITRTSMVVAKDLNVKTLADLQGKRLAEPAGSMIEAKLRSAITEKNWNMTIVPVRSNWVGMHDQFAGKVDALGNAHYLPPSYFSIPMRTNMKSFPPASTRKPTLACYQRATRLSKNWWMTSSLA